MAEVYNHILDESQRYIDLSKDAITNSSFWNTLKTTQYVNVVFKDCSQIFINPYLQNLCKFIRNSNHEKSTEFRYEHKLHVKLNYNDRRSLVNIITLAFFITGLFRGRPFRTALKKYFIYSLFLCRENFDLRNYKLQI